MKDEVRNLISNELLPKIRRDQCILFVGAGLSYEAGLPSVGDLAKRIWQALPEETRPEIPILSEVAEIYLTTPHTKQELVEFVKRALVLPKGEALDTTTFDLIAHIPHLNKTIITTNWDTLIEEAINKAIGVRPTVVIRDIDIGQLPGAEHVVYKIHGSWDAPETFVITERDYRLKYTELFDPSSLVMANVRALLTNKTIIYVGCSLREEYFDELLRQIRNALTDNRTGEFMGRTSYLVTPEEPDREARRRLKGLRIRWIEATARDFFTFVFRETAEFVNRQEELQMIRSLKEPYVEICGNAGIGKTRLLQELAIKYRYTDNWFNVFYIDLKGGNPLDLIREQDETVKEVEDLSKRTGLLITMDSLDRAVDLDKAMEFISQALNRDIRTQRIIWATRYSIYDRLPFIVKFRTSSYLLSSMLTKYVAEMAKSHVELIEGITWAEEDYERLADAIITLTGMGHPGLIVEVLRMLGEAATPFSIDYLRGNRKRILDALRNKLRIEVFGEEKPEVEEELKPITRLMENTFCAMRGITPGMIAELVKDGKIETEDLGDAEDIFKALLDTHLLDRTTYPLYKIDATVRYVLALCLQEEAQRRFEEINGWCVDYFWDALQKSREDLQRSFVREWLFHRIIQLDGKISPQESWDLLSKDLGQITLWSIEERAKDRLAAEVMGDEELKNLLLEYLGDELYSALLQELTQLEAQG